VGDSDRGVHSERAVECVSGRNLGYVRLGDVRAVEEDAHSTGEQIIIARVLDGALWNRRCQLDVRQGVITNTCRYAIGDLRGVVTCVMTTSKGTIATSTLCETPSLGMVINASAVYLMVIELFEMAAALCAS